MQNVMRTTGLFGALLVAVAASRMAPAAGLRKTFETTDLVVVGRVQSVEDGPLTRTYVKNAPTVFKEERSLLVHIATSNALKGAQTTALDVVVPLREETLSGFPKGAEGKDYVFFVDKAVQPGQFIERTSVKPVVLEAPGCSFRLSTERGPIRLTSTEVDTSLPPLLRLADLLANQLNSKGLVERMSPSSSYFRLIWELTPERKAEDKPLTVTEAKRYGHWLTSRFTRKLDLTDRTVAMNYAALAAAWGFKGENSKAFCRLYKENSGQGLYGSLPPLTVDEFIDVFPSMPTDVAAGYAWSFKDQRTKRAQILQILLPRLGQSQDLDKGILEALAKLYDKPELDPNVNRESQTVGEKVQRARQLLGG